MDAECALIGAVLYVNDQSTESTKEKMEAQQMVTRLNALSTKIQSIHESATVPKAQAAASTSKSTMYQGTQQSPPTAHEDRHSKWYKEDMRLSEWYKEDMWKDMQKWTQKNEESPKYKIFLPWLPNDNNLVGPGLVERINLITIEKLA